ncbi:hypothetical protein PENSPDRAFT_747751 [Peniophora sp. CONT]|nr:hypothetical protein PENSPDRAFT_747751 [Peniophora sp. CONT]
MSFDSPVAFFPDILANVESVRAAIIANGADDRAQCAVDGDIARLEDAVLQLKRIRNSCTPLVRLPLEVLAEIAERLITIWPSVARYPKGFRSEISLGWVRLSHVCSGLRSALLHCRHLWARNISNMPFPPEFVYARCGDVPLTLIIRPYSTDEMVAFISDHLVQAREIDWMDSLDARNSAIIDTLSSTGHPHLLSHLGFPHLESLSFSLRMAKYRKPDMPDDGYKRPTMVAPRLRSLHLDDVMIPFQPGTLTSLTLRFDQRKPLTVDNFFDLLKRCVLLENLAVYGGVTALPATNHENSGTRGLVVLPHLLLIDVYGSIEMCMTILSSISTPRLLTTDIQISDTQANDLECAPYLLTLAPILQSAAPGVVGVTMRNYSTWDDDDGGERTLVSIILHTSDPGHVDSDIWVDGPFAKNHHTKLKLRFKIVDSIPPQYLESLDTASSTIGHASINTLEVGCVVNYAYTPATWSASFARFSHVNTLFFSNRQHTWALQALLVPDTPRGEGIPILPSLRFLWLKELHVYYAQGAFVLSGRRSEGDTQTTAISDVQFLEVLESRSRCGSALERLRIGKLFMNLELATQSFLPRVRAIVPIVECGKIHG